LLDRVLLGFERPQVEEPTAAEQDRGDEHRGNGHGSRQREALP